VKTEKRKPDRGEKPPRFEVLPLKLRQLADLVPTLNRKVKKNQSVVHIDTPVSACGKWHYDVIVENQSFVSLRLNLPRLKKGGAR
jgi:hypothetical protein